MDTNTEVTNIKDKNTRHDGLVKILLSIITILLLVLVFLQVQATRQEQVIQPLPSEKCIEARQLAQVLLQSDLDIMDSYEEDVFGSGTDNINQQIFRVNEYQYFTLEKIALQQKALLYMIVECQW